MHLHANFFKPAFLLLLSQKAGLKSLHVNALLLKVAKTNWLIILLLKIALLVFL
jgi:hypothetical protein